MLKQLICALLSIGVFAASSLAFQPSAPPPTSRSAATSRSFHHDHGHRPTSTRILRRHQHRSDSTSHAFGGPGGLGQGGFGHFLVDEPPPPIRTTRDALRRLQRILTSTLRQSFSGFTNGYLLALVWGVFRGPSLVVENRAVTWGLDCGVLSALFSSTNGVAEFLLALPTRDDGEEEEMDAGSKSPTRRQKATLWSAVGRNMLLAAYFGRGGGGVQIARSAALYGGLTWLFVGRKMKRDAERGVPSVLGGGTGGPGGMGGGQASRAMQMQQLLQQMLVAQGGIPPNGSVGPPNKTTSTPKSSPKKKARSTLDQRARENAVDVEFEKTKYDDEDMVK